MTCFLLKLFQLKCIDCVLFVAKIKLINSANSVIESCIFVTSVVA